LVTEDIDRNLELSARNLGKVRVSTVAGLDPVSLVRFENVVVTAAALDRVGEWLA
jgi:large subunit ribosomal protein L4